MTPSQAIIDHLTQHPGRDFTYQELGEAIGRSPTYAGELTSRIAAEPVPGGQVVKHREGPGKPMLVRYDPAPPPSAQNRRPRWR